MTDRVSIAVYDQCLTKAQHQLAGLRSTLAALEERSGETQGMADLLALLASWDRTEVASVLAAACREGRR